MRTRRVATLLVLFALAASIGACRRGSGDGSPRISPYRELQRYTLEGPITPIGLPIAGEQIRIDLLLHDARRAEGSLSLFRNDVWTRFGDVEGSWDGETMELFTEDGGGSAMRFELAFERGRAWGMAVVLFARRGEAIRYSVELAYR